MLAISTARMCRWLALRTTLPDEAEHIEEGYEKRGIPENEAERRAWATVNKESHGGKKSGSGRGKKESRSASRKGGRKGGRKKKRR